MKQHLVRQYDISSIPTRLLGKNEECVNFQNMKYFHYIKETALNIKLVGGTELVDISNDALNNLRINS